MLRKIFKVKNNVSKAIKKNEVAVKQKHDSVHYNVVHSNEDLIEIRKSFLIIFLFSILLFIGIIVYVFISSLPSKQLDNSKTTNSNEQTVVDYIYSSINDLNDGSIVLDNKHLLRLFDSVNFKKNEKIVYDSTYLFSKDEMSLENIDEDYLLFLLTKTSDFTEYINNSGILTKYELCNKEGMLKIPYADVYEMVLSRFNVRITGHDDFIYAHYVNGNFSTYVKFIYSDGYYVSSCLPSIPNTYSSNAEMYIESAFKNNNEVIIRVNVAFSKFLSLYADYEMTKLLTSGENYDIFQYLPYASKYEFVYLLGTNNNYYLSKVVKVNTAE